MDKTKNIIIFFLIFLLGFSITFAINNYLRTGDNWDASVDPGSPVNDKWTLDGRLDLEDSLTADYSSLKRGEISGSIESELFGTFNINDFLKLTFKSNSSIPSECGDSLEVYSITGDVSSIFWGDMTIKDNSFFCSNQYVYINLYSTDLGNKDIGNITQSDFIIDNFDKQKISISGIVKLKGDEDNILSRETNSVNDIYIDSNKKTIAKSIVNKNIAINTRGLTPDTSNYELADLDNMNSKEKIYYYDYTGNTDTIQFKNIDYINEGKTLKIGYGDDKTAITGKNTVIVKSGNIYIKNDLYNTDDSKSLLVLVAKKNKDTGNGGNIYIDPYVTNIDAVLIADGSIISFDGTHIQDIENFPNKLRKQLLIYGSVMTSNSIGTNEIPYGADLYEKFNSNVIDYSIYDLANLRTFNLNYGGDTDCNDGDELVPINGNGGYKLNAWAGKRECYLSDDVDDDLRGSDKLSPVVIMYNSRIQFLNPLILKNN